MKKILLSLLANFLLIGGIFSQTYATDFNATDCDGNAHHLFSELDNGKVVVIAWVMPCNPCVPDPLNAYTIVQGYASTNPGKVLFYLADDYANTTCQSLATWAGNFGMGSCIKFSDAAVNMGDYGQPGMPKLVVLGGDQHKVYYNENSSSQGITAAIDQAIAESPTAINTLNKGLSISTYPNPVNNTLNIDFNPVFHASLQLEIFNLLGARVYSDKIFNNQNKETLQIDVNGLENGAYFLKIHDGATSGVVKFSVSR